MKPQSYSIFAALAMLTFCNIGFSQVKTKIFKDGIPVERIRSNIETKEVIFDEPEEIEKIRSEIEKQSSSTYSNRFAHSISANLNFIKEAPITTVSQYTHYSLTIKATGALNLSLNFNNFVLSPNAVLSIYNDYELTDSITAKENNELNLWATRVYQGNKIILLLTVPNNEIGKSVINISHINYGIEKFGGSYFGNPGTSATCNINIACN